MFKGESRKERMHEHGDRGTRATHPNNRNAASAASESSKGVTKELALESQEVRDGQPSATPEPAMETRIGRRAERAAVHPARNQSFLRVPLTYDMASSVLAMTQVLLPCFPSLLLPRVDFHCLSFEARVEKSTECLRSNLVFHNTCIHTHTQMASLER